MNNETPSPESISSKPEVGSGPAPYSGLEGTEPRNNKGGVDATRNLVLGVMCVVIGVPIAGAALIWAGKEAFVALATAVSLGLVVFLALQARLLRQPNGTFLLLSLGMVLTATIPVAVRLFESGSEIARVAKILSQQQQDGLVGLQPSHSQPTQAVSTPSVQVPTPAPATPTSPSPTESSSKVAQKSSEKPAEVPPNPDFQQPKVPEVNPNSVADRASAPADKGSLSVTSDVRPDEDPIQRATRLAKDEAVKRYPALTVPGSQEHSLYLEAYNELARLRKFEFFKDPQWPLKLAESVAQREGWKRGEQAQSEAPKVAAKPAQKTPAAPLPGEELALDGPQAAVPADPVEQATNRAIIEVRRRYPALGNNGSPENQIYLEAYSELKRLRPDFFEKPEWPIHLAEIVAKREGWRRQENGRPPVENASSVEPPLPK